MARPRKTFARERPKNSGIYYTDFYDKSRSPARKYVRLRSATFVNAQAEAVRLRDRWALPLAHPDHFDPWGAPKEVGLRMEDAITRHIADLGHLSPHTLTGKEYALLRIARSLGNPPPNAVAAEDLVAYFRSPSEQTEAVRTWGTIQQGLGHCRVFWDWCMGKGYANQNPAHDARKELASRRSVRTRAAEKGSPRDAMTPEEVAKVAELAGNYRAAIELAVCTGMRLREVVSRNRSHVETDGTTGVLYVNSYTVGKERFVTKSGKDREVPLVPRAAKIVADILAQPGGPDDPLFVSPTSRSNAPWTRHGPHALSGAFRDARRGLGYPETYKFHSLRHSFVTYLLLLGLPPYAVAEMAGHRGGDTQATYVHMVKALSRGGAQKAAVSILRFFLPDVPEEVLREEVGDVESRVGLSHARHGILGAMGAHRAWDVLFSGALDAKIKDGSST